MRLRDVAGVVAVSAGLLLAGCSKLTFVKADAQRGDAERVAPDYDFSESPRDRQRSSARRLLATANRKFEAGELAAAEADARAALKADGSSFQAHTLLGLIASHGGDAVAAGGHYAKAAEVAPDNPIALGNYGLWLCANGRAAESLDWFDKALAVPRGRGEATLANAGACALKAGRPELAEKASRVVLQADPDNVVALGTMAEYNYATAHYLEARAFSQRRLAAAPATPDALRLASQIEEKLGDTVAATRYVQRLRTEFPPAGTANPGEIAQP